MMDGRVKTLHPEGAWRPARDPRQHRARRARWQEHGIRADRSAGRQPLSVRGDGREGADYDDCIENIDIGGPAMIRAAAKNHADRRGRRRARRLRGAARRARRATAARPRWRCARSSPPRPTPAPPPTTRRSPTGSPDGSTIRRRPSAPSAGRLAEALRYGENPHQSAAFYRTPDDARRASPPRGRCRASSSPTTTSTTPTRPTNASPNSIRRAPRPCAIIKHANPCGVAEGASLVEAYRKALRLRSDLGVRRHRRAQPHARRRGGARHHRDFHRGDHRAGRHRRGDQDRRGQEEPAAAAGRRPARSARRRA